MEDVRTFYKDGKKCQPLSFVLPSMEKGSSCTMHSIKVVKGIRWHFVARYYDEKELKQLLLNFDWQGQREAAEKGGEREPYYQKETVSFGRVYFFPT